MNDDDTKELNSYEQKQEDRRERLLARADKKSDESSARYAAARRTLDVIPFGQPVLVGHHSEKRHRKDLERVDNNLRKSFEASDHASDLRRRADAVGTAGISSDDPDAITKLETELAGEKEAGELCKSWNKQIRKLANEVAKGRGVDVKSLGRADFRMVIDQFPDMPEVIKKALISYNNAFPWLPQMSSNSANVRRIEKRIEELRKRDADPERETLEGSITVEVNGMRDSLPFKIEDNKHANRVQVWFSTKPPKELCENLKRHGFKWSPTGGVWQRMRSNGAWYNAKRVLGVS